MAYLQHMLYVDGNAIPCPSVMNWGLQDVSAPDSGRVLDGNDTMYKNRTSQKVKLELQWNGVDPEKIQQILLAFNPEYFNVTYYDPMLGNTTKTFYCGDRSAPVKIWWGHKKVYEQVSFNIIER